MNDQKANPGRPSEAERLAELRAYQVLDTGSEPAFDGLVQLAAVISDVPTALIGLIDENREWFKAKLGVEGDAPATPLVITGRSAVRNRPGGRCRT